MVHSVEMAMPKVIKCFLLLFVIEVMSASLESGQAIRTLEYRGQTTEKLLVSQYIKAGRIEEARELSLVTGLEPNITSYAGYLTVNEECDSNLFYWFFPSQNDMDNDPFSVWLQGGPGSSSLFGLLNENGPYVLTLDGKLELREFSWNRNSSIIYFDSPVGTGFSYTGRDECYATEETQVERELLNALQQFLLLFPELQDNPFYITGESYGGKYVPGLAYEIHNNEDAKNINLKGIAVGNGLVDPINQVDFSSLFYQLGLVDRNRRDLMAREEETVRVLIEAGLYGEANDAKDFVLLGLFGFPYGFLKFYNLLYNLGEPEPDIAGFVSQPEVKEALHVGNATYDGTVSLKVLDNFHDSFMRSRRSWLQEVMENYRVLLYSGQLDLIVSYQSTMNYLEKMDWSGAEEYRTAERLNWYVGDELAGYSKTVKNFTEVLVRNAGHMVPTDQPKWAFDLYQKLIFNEQF